MGVRAPHRRAPALHIDRQEEHVWILGPRSACMHASDPSLVSTDRPRSNDDADAFARCILQCASPRSRATRDATARACRARQPGLYPAAPTRSVSHPASRSRPARRGAPMHVYARPASSNAAFARRSPRSLPRSIDQRQDGWFPTSHSGSGGTGRPEPCRDKRKSSPCLGQTEK